MTPTIRFQLARAVALAAAGLAVLTAVVPEWIEAVTPVDPDAGSGALEWAVVLVLVLLATTGGLLARREHGRIAADPA